MEQYLPIEKITLNGKSVTVRPLEAADYSGLFYSFSHTMQKSWYYMKDHYPDNKQLFQEEILLKSKFDDPYYFVILNHERPVGIFSLMRYDPSNRVVEVGNILYSDSLKQTKGATEAQYLLMRYAFESLKVRRYEWKCDNDNLPSKKAALRLGFQFEGLFRQHMFYKGRNRDTAWFSIIDSEWPAQKVKFEKWLDGENFDDNNRQIRKLEDF